MNKNKTILVVDDNSLNRKILSKLLSAEGYNILEAENGKIAFDIISNVNNKVDLALLDLSMPVMNGYEFLSKMTETGIIKKVSVIVTTGTDYTDTEIQSLKLGASDFITKPYNADIVRYRVKNIFKLRDNATLINQLEIDRLTGVYNREAFFYHAKRKMLTYPDIKFEIVCSDIENFKLINTKYGMNTADSLLKYIATCYQHCAGSHEICGRLGSDNFVILRKKREHKSQEEIGQIYAETYKDAPVKNFTMKFGIYGVEDSSLPVSSMCDRANMAVASIKHKYGLYYAVYNDSMNQKLEREHQLTDYMEQALKEKQFKLYLQPKHSSNTGELAGAEALVRWVHPELGFISPGEFIPLFEKNGFVSKLDRFIWEEVCRVLQQWISDGKKCIPISVNVSRIDFISGNLPEFISNLVDSYNIPHEYIHLEITESAYSENPQQIISDVSSMRNMGFLVEMDDFGSGYSSLNMLAELPIDILKLDMRFIQNKNASNRNSKMTILNFIIGLSKWLQYPTIAEGVETKDEIELLKTMGCDYIQGYFFSKPVPVPDFETYKERSIASTSEQQKNNVQKIIKQNTALDNSKPVVLIAEDIEVNRKILIELMKGEYSVVAVENGKEAYEYIQQHHAKINCLLLDLLMPVMDGFQLLELMKKEGYLEEIPVVITSEASGDSELRAIHLGAESFVAKPYNAELLLHHIKQASDECEFKRLERNLQQEKNL